jgi:L-fucose mutarotase
MLKIALMHPDLLAVLSLAGQGSQVLISDGNYPYNTHSNPKAARVYLNLTAGVLSATQVLEVLTKVIPIETAQVMHPAGAASATVEPTIWEEFRRLIPSVTLKQLDRKAFHDATNHRDVALVIATGEQRPYGSILLTIGVLEAASVLPDLTPAPIAESIATEAKVEPKVEIEEKAPRAKKTTKPEPIVTPEVVPEVIVEPEPEVSPVEVVVAAEEPTIEELAESLIVIADEDLSDPFADDIPVEVKEMEIDASEVKEEAEVKIAETKKEKAEPEKKAEEVATVGSLFE